MQKEAKIAEAKAEAESRIVSAQQQRIGREAEIKSELSVVKNDQKNPLLILIDKIFSVSYKCSHFTNSVTQFRISERFRSHSF